MGVVSKKKKIQKTKKKKVNQWLRVFLFADINIFIVMTIGTALVYSGAVVGAKDTLRI